MQAKAKHVEIFTDGACRGNPGPGGWGAILRYNKHEKHLKELGFFEKKRSQRLFERMQEMIRIDFEQRFWDTNKIEFLNSKMEDILQRRITPQKIILELKKLDN